MRLTHPNQHLVGSTMRIVVALGSAVSASASSQDAPNEQTAPQAAQDVDVIQLDRAFVPAGLLDGQASVDREQAAIAEIQKTLGIGFHTQPFGELQLPGATPIESDRAIAPVLLAPDPNNVRQWLSSAQQEARPKGVYDTSYSEQDYIPGASPGTSSGESALFQPVRNSGPSGFKASKPWGVDEAQWNAYVPVEQAGRFTHRFAGVQMAKQPSLSPIGTVRTWLGTDRVWGYAVWDKRFPKDDPERGWLYALAEANSLPRADDPLAKTRLSPSTNHVETMLPKNGWPELIQPYIVPRPYERVQGEDRTEAIAVSDKLLKAAGGAIVVRAAETWSPESPDFVFDADLRIHDRILAVVIDQRVSSQRLVEIVAALCETGDDATIAPIGTATNEQLIARLIEIRER